MALKERLQDLEPTQQPSEWHVNQGTQVERLILFTTGTETLQHQLQLNFCPLIALKCLLMTTKILPYLTSNLKWTQVLKGGKNELWFLQYCMFIQNL